MAARKWIVGVVASVMPWITQAQDGVFDAPQRVDGLAVYLDFEPAAMAPNWAKYHRPTAADAAEPPVRPDLDRHVVVVVIDEKAGRRVADADIQITLTRTLPPGKSYSRRLERMTRGADASYGTIVTIDPQARCEFEIAVRRPGQKQPSRVNFETGSGR